ncbi:MAG: HAD family phosphatase [Actinomycetota bacterium]|nr:HAD family phosphatase [Actinomycetota bacterium]
MISAVLFDFNGTLSDDEPVLCAIWQEIFARLGKPMSEEDYYGRLAGRAEPEVAELWLGARHPALEEVLAERVRLYRDRVADGSTVTEPVREAVRYAAERVPVGVVSGAMHADIDPVLTAAGIADHLSVVVAADEIEHGKPDPEGFLLALERLPGRIEAADVVALEDTAAGVAAAKAAGMRCVAVTGTMGPDRLAEADELVERIDVPLMRRLLD